MALTVSVCFLCLSETLVGSGGVYRRFLRTKTCAQTNRVGCTTNVLQDVRRTADASRLSQGFRAKEPSVDPTRRVNTVYVCFFCAEVFIVNLRADLRKYSKKLSYRQGTARCVASVEILPIAKQQCRKYLYD